MDYSGMPVCRHFTDNEVLAKRVCTAVFDSPEWVLLDMGVITEEDGIKKMISRLDTEEEKELAVKSFDHWHEYNLVQKPEMGDLGIFASLDPVAVDQACYDSVFNSPDPRKAALIERMESRHGIHTVEAAAQHGLGSREYEIVSLD